MSVFRQRFWRRRVAQRREQEYEREKGDDASDARWAGGSEASTQPHEGAERGLHRRRGRHQPADKPGWVALREGGLRSQRRVRLRAMKPIEEAESVV